MADQDFKVKNGIVVNTAFSANSSGIYYNGVQLANTTSANNAGYLGGQTPAYYAVNTTVFSTFAQNTSVYSTFAQNTSVYSTFAQNTAVYSTFAQNTAIYSYAASNSYVNNTFQTSAGLSANVATLTSNNSTYAFGKSEISLNVNNALTSNNSSYLGTVVSSSYIRKDSTSTIATGYNVTSYSLASSSFTVDPTLGNYQYINSLTASITITAPASDCAVDIMITNGAGAGLAFSGFTVQTGGTGDAYATTSGNKYLIMIRRINGISTYMIKSLQ